MLARQSPDVHLVTCIGVETELALVPHFLDHYLELGVPAVNFHVILNTTQDASDNLCRARALLHERAVEESEHWIAPYTSESMWAKRREVQLREVPRHSWVLSADVDEFHEYPLSLPAFLDYCDEYRVNCVQGMLIDRLSLDGALGQVRADTPLWQSFPVQADVQCSIGQTGQHYDLYGSIKLMLFKDGVLPARGGHDCFGAGTEAHYLFGAALVAFPNIADSGFRFSVPLRVHHFKWNASLRSTLARRLATPGVSPAGKEYGQRLIDYFDANERVVLASVPTRQVETGKLEHWRRRIAHLRLLGWRYRTAGHLSRLVRKIRKLPKKLFRSFAA